MVLFLALALLQVPVPSDGSVARARELSDAATAHYNAGRFDQAAPLFREAHELSGNTALLFNLAQSYRRGGDCRQAVASYRRFLEHSQDATLRPKAELLLSQLLPACPDPPAAPVAAAVRPPPIEPAASPVLPASGSPDVTASVAGGSPPPGPSREASRRLPMVTGVVAAAAAIAAGAVAFIDHRRYAIWQGEDRTLAEDGPGLTMAERVLRQDANDDRLRSIRRWDRVTVGLAITAGLATVATVALWGDKPVLKW